MTRWEDTYREVKHRWPELFERAVQIGHLALPQFVPDRQEAAGKIEEAIVHLIKDIMEPDL